MTVAFNAALSGPDYTLLRSTGYAGDYLITLCANTVLLHGTVQSDLTTPTSWAQFSYTLISGTYTDVDKDMVLIIGTVNDITKAEFRGRVRLAPSASVIYSSESSQDFTYGNWFWIISAFDPTYILSRPDASGNELVDYNLPYAGPQPMVLGLRTAYVDNVDSGTGKMRVAFDVSASYATVPSGTISSYQFTFKAGTYTVISGSLASSAVTVDFNPGEQWGKLVITDSGGVTKTRRFYIKAHDANNPPDLGFDNCTITGDLTRGWSLSVPAFAGVDSVLRDTFCVVWRANELYGGTAGQLYPTNNIAFVGWLQREDVQAQADQTASIVEDARFEFTGFGPRMARLTAQLLAIRISASPAVWGELATLTPWRAICHFLSHYTTIANLCDVDFSDKSDTFLFPTISTQGGNVFNAVGGIAGQIDALLETAPDGRIQFNRNAEYLTAAQRAALTAVAAFTTDDIISAAKSQEQNRNVGKVDGDGATYNPATGQVTVFTARAPGHAQGEAGGSSTLSGQILTYNANPDNVRIELRQRVGSKYEIDNNSETLSTEHPDGYAPLFIPSKGQLFTFTLSALTANGVDRIDYTTADYWTLESVTITRQGNGATSVRNGWRKLNRVGDAADDTTLTPEVIADDPTPDLGVDAFPFQDPDVLFPEVGVDLSAVNPVQLAPPPGTVLATNGQTVIASNGTNAWLLKNFITLKKPIAVDVTPADLASYTIKQVLFDPFGTRTAQGAYILASDGVNSAVWWTANVAVPKPVWTKGVALAGVYTVIRAGNVAGSALIYSPGNVTPTTVDYDFTASNQGFTLTPAAAGYTPPTSGQYVAGVGWRTTLATGFGQTYRSVDVERDLGASQTITALSFTFDRSTGAAGANVVVEIGAGSTPGTWLVRAFPGATGTNQVISWTGSVSAQFIQFHTNTGQSGDGSDPGGECTLKAAHVEYAANLNSKVAYSSTYGATFGAPVSVGASPGSVGGFDTQRAGANVFAAYTGKIARSTNSGTTFSDYYTITGGAQATCVIIPYFKWGSTTVRNTNAANPDIVVGLSAADGSSRTLLWIEGGATPGTVHDITPVASYVFDNPNSITTSYGTAIAVAGKVGTTYTLRTSKTLGGAGTWANIATLTTPHFIRTRRGDNSILRGKGQLYVQTGNTIDYSGFWGASGIWPRTLPAAGVDSMDILG